MTASKFLCRFRWRHTQLEMAAILADAAPGDAPTQQELIDQLDAGVVRQFQRMLDENAD